MYQCFQKLFRWEDFSDLPYGGIAGLCALPIQDGIFIAGGQFQVQ